MYVKHTFFKKLWNKKLIGHLWELLEHQQIILKISRKRKHPAILSNLFYVNCALGKPNIQWKKRFFVFFLRYHSHKYRGNNRIRKHYWIILNIIINLDRASTAAKIIRSEADVAFRNAWTRLTTPEIVSKSRTTSYYVLALLWYNSL